MQKTFLGHSAPKPQSPLALSLSIFEQCGCFDTCTRPAESQEQMRTNAKPRNYLRLQKDYWQENIFWIYFRQTYLQFPEQFLTSSLTSDLPICLISNFGNRLPSNIPGELIWGWDCQKARYTSNINVYLRQNWCWNIYTYIYQLYVKITFDLGFRIKYVYYVGQSC